VAKTLIIAAATARGFAQAAVACGHEVIALDAFIDEETSKICKQTFKLKFDDFRLDESHFKQVFVEINISDVTGFLYGSLFDSCPDILDWVAKQLSVLGNSAEVLKQAKDFSFFALLDDLNIAHPDVFLGEKSCQLPFPHRRESIFFKSAFKGKMDSRLRGNDGIEKEWLSKRIGGCGGMHIRLANAQKKVENAYFQHKVAGMPISMLFVADGNTAHLIGFNRQLTAPTKSLPYRFAGAISNVVLQPNIQAAFEHAAQKLTSALHLRGICSLDAIVSKNGGESADLWVLELNPRLSATFQLYENLLPQHLQGCAGHLPNISVETSISHAQLILYADEALIIPQHFAWPSWVADIPAAASHDSDIKTSVKISQHTPICTVLASAKSAELAHTLLLQRAEKLTEMLKIIQND
jgi:predicted ATP-grasp superfamily ATP-dependent carboligase